MLLLVTVMDVLGAAVFVAGWELHRRATAPRGSVGGVPPLSIQAYSVAVRGLPRDVLRAEEVEEYFSRFGDVADVVIATARAPPLSHEAQRLTRP